jgi:lipopolysaccharide biosynthesis protein
MRAIAFYLPQYHPIPENDEWWGTGFTEWTNVAKATPLFPGHYQPRLPADLGYYDLRVPEVRQAQAMLAGSHGIEAFCYYHYWFGGRQLLQRPFEEVLRTGEPDFPFCLCWANQTWSGIWHGAPNKILMEQTYPGPGDHEAHFAALLPAFRDRRYLRVEGRPLFLVYMPDEVPELEATLAHWRGMATEAGLPGLFLVAVTQQPGRDWTAEGFDGAEYHAHFPRRNWYPWSQPRAKVRRWLDRKLGYPVRHEYRNVIANYFPERLPRNTVYPCVIPDWDNTARSGKNGVVLCNSTPGLFRGHVRQAIGLIRGFDPERRLLFVKSWNEWAEGNYLEPDAKFGHAYLEALRDELAAARR